MRAPLNPTLNLNSNNLMLMRRSSYLRLFENTAGYRPFTERIRLMRLIWAFYCMGNMTPPDPDEGAMRIQPAYFKLLPITSLSSLEKMS